MPASRKALLGEWMWLGRNDGDGVDAVWAFGFGLAISAKGGVGAVWGDVEVLGGFGDFSGLERGRRLPVRMVVDARGYAVDCAMKAGLGRRLPCLGGGGGLTMSWELRRMAMRFFLGLIICGFSKKRRTVGGRYEKRVTSG